jgi:outer membrane protein TolC
LTLSCVVAACTSPQMRREEADRAVYAALERRRACAPFDVGSLDVDRADCEAEAVRRSTDVTLDVATSLRLAATGSREYRSRREDVYLTGLAYVGARHAFETRFSLGATAALAGDDDSGTASVAPSGGASRALVTGGSIALDVVTTLLKSLWGSPLETAQSILSADWTIPLGRGGRDVARESLTQAEHDLLYALRGYARYQQEFAVRVASSFYRTVAQRDTVANEEATYKSLTLVYERAQALGPDGRGSLPGFQVDQARQDVLRADDRRIRARQAYEASLDQLKILLGLPVASRVTIREDALEVLRARGLVPPALALEEAASVALAARLDLLDARDQRGDADRKVLVAADGLGPRIDLTLGASLSTPATQPGNLGRASGSGSVGLDLDLPVERQAERDAYRLAIVQAARAKRDVEGLEDLVLSQVREAWRALDQARQSHAIQEEGVRLAERRVESADLNFQAGTATTRDVLEAQDALIEARNALTRALVDHAVALLEFERDTGVLRPGPLLGTAVGG